MSDSNRKCACKNCRRHSKQTETVPSCGTTNKLENWQKWLQRRKEIHQKLSSSTQRPPNQLLMNSGDEYRQINEERLMFEYAKYDSNFDKYRGNPQDFFLPPCLKDPCNPLEPSEYYLQKSRDQLKKPPDIEHVVVPDAISREKDVFPRERNVFTTWQESAYRKERANFLAEKLREMEPFKPAANALVLIGKNIIEDPGGSGEVPVVNQKVSRSEEREVKTKFTSVEVSVKEETEQRSVSERRFEEESLRVNISQGSIQTFFTHSKGLIINGQSFYASNCTDTRRIRMLFEKPSSTACGRAEMILTNPSLTTLRVHFNKYEKFRLFDEYEHNPEQAFYFNKNELILIPGESRTISIWFKPALPGSYAEYYEIHTKPPIYYGNNKLLLMLLGQAYNNFYEDSKEIEAMLNERTARRIAKSTIDKLINNMAQYYPESKAKDCVITEKEIFESANQDLKLMENRTKYLYNKNVVQELKDLFEEVKLSHHPKEWNYSVKDLKMYARQKDLFVFFEKKLALREKERIQLLTNEINSPVEGAERKSIGKRKGTTPKTKAGSRQASVSKKLSISQPDPIEKEEVVIQPKSFYYRVAELIGKLERPSMIENKDRQKYLMAFLVLRSAITRMSWQISDLECSQRFSFPPFPAHTEYRMTEYPDRLIFERFDDLIVPRKKLYTSRTEDEIPCYPKPAYLSKVNRTDTTRVLKAYLQSEEQKEQIVSTNEDSRRKTADGGKKKKEPKGGTKKSLRPNSDVKTDMEDFIKPDFNPFARTKEVEEVPLDHKDEEKSTSKVTYKDRKPNELDQELEEKTLKIDRWIHNELFMIIRKNLTEGIMDICEIVDSYSDEVPQPEVLHMLKSRHQVTEDQCKYHFLEDKLQQEEQDEKSSISSKTVLEEKLKRLAKEQAPIEEVEVKRSASKRIGLRKSKSKTLAVKKATLEEIQVADPAKQLMDKLTSTLPIDVEETFEQDHKYISELMDLHWRKNEATKRIYIEGGKLERKQSKSLMGEDESERSKYKDLDPPAFEPMATKGTTAEMKEFTDISAQTSFNIRNVSTLIYSGRPETSVSNFLLEGEDKEKEEPKEFKFYYLDNAEDVFPPQSGTD